MQRTFWKMHGIGNDYIYFDCFDSVPHSPEQLAVRLSDRHFSVGGDGIVLILPSKIADAKMRMFNADGSEGRMCGNAIRCVGKFLYEVRNLQKETLTVETLSGVKTLRLTVEEGRVTLVTVDMGKAELDPTKIPARFEGDRAVNVPLVVDGTVYHVTCVSMGNPHCVVFCDDPYKIDLERVGTQFENHSVFPERVNTEFVRVIGRNELEMRVWERGSGETFACGTGACAAAVAAILNGFFTPGEEICVRLRGGTLVVRYEEGAVYMTGSAEFAFRGTVEIQ